MTMVFKMYIFVLGTRLSPGRGAHTALGPHDADGRVHVELELPLANNNNNNNNTNNNNNNNDNNNSTTNNDDNDNNNSYYYY